LTLVAFDKWDFLLLRVGVLFNIVSVFIVPFTLLRPITATPLVEKVAHMSFWVVAIVECVFDLSFLSLGAILILALSKFIRWFGRRHLGLSQNLLLAFPNGNSETLELDDWVIAWLMLFLINFLVGPCLYRSLYISTGTVNPGWLVVFG
jgi:hypothetical protein